MSTVRKKAAFVVLCIVATCALAFYLIVHNVQRVHDDTCSGLTAIASDSSKIQYVRAWLTARTNDKYFMDAVRRNRYFEPGDPRLRQYIDLNWGYLGLVPEYASIAFNVKNRDSHDFDAAAIESVSLSQGRSSIIIKLGSADDLGLLLPAAELKKIKAVHADVFMYCEFES